MISSLGVERERAILHQVLEQLENVATEHLTGVKGTVLGTFSGAMIVTSFDDTVWPGSDSSQFPPVSAARSTMTEPGFIVATIALVISVGALRPGCR